VGVAGREGGRQVFLRGAGTWHQGRGRGFLPVCTSPLPAVPPILTLPSWQHSSNMTPSFFPSPPPPAVTPHPSPFLKHSFNMTPSLPPCRL
jgi:hypothetical protein